MKHLSTARRVAAVITAASVAGLIAVTAVLAGGSPGTVLAADTASAPAAPVPACTAADLGVWFAVTQGNGAAGSIYYPLEFTNLTRHACVMRGFPGVSVLDRHGHQLGSPARWDPGVRARTVLLAAGATAHTILRWSDATVSTAPGCHPTFAASQLRIYPPGQYGATYAAFNLESCSHAGPAYLSVTEPIVPGVGTVNG